MKDITLKNIPLAECVISIIAILIATFIPLATANLTDYNFRGKHPQLIIRSYSGIEAATLDIWGLETTIHGDLTRSTVKMKIDYRKIRLTPFGVNIPNRILLIVALAYALIAVIKAASNIKTLYFVSVLLLACSMSHCGYIIYLLSGTNRITLGIGSIFLPLAFLALIICSIIEFLQLKGIFTHNIVGK